MSRRIGLMALAALALGLTGLMLWLVDEGPPPDASQAARVTSPATKDGAGTVLPQALPRQDVEPLEPTAVDTSSDPDAPSENASAPTRIHAYPFQELSLSGRIVNSRGQPLRDAAVILNPSEKTRRQQDLPMNYFFEAPAWDRFPQTRSEPDGTFTFTAQSAGDAEGQRLPIPKSVRHQYDDATTLVARLPGFVPAAVLVPADGWTVPMGDIVLQEAGVVTGRLIDPSSVALPGLRVSVGVYGRLDDRDGMPDWSLVKRLIETHSQADGRFRLDTLDPGRFRLEAVGAGQQVHSFEVEVTAGQTVDVGDLVIQPGRILAGRVVDEDGVGLEGAALKARPSTLLNLSPGEDTALRDIRVRVISSSGDREVSAESGPDGVFRFDDLDDTSYVLLASHEGRDPVALRKLTPDITDLELVLPVEARLVIRLVDAQSQQPVWGNVDVVRMSNAAATEPDGMDARLKVLENDRAAEALGLELPADGLYLASPAGFLGNHVSVTAEGHAPLKVLLPGVPPGEMHEHSLEMLPASTLAGRITDAQGAPLTDAEITVSDAAPGEGIWRERKSARIAEDGTWHVDGLSAGDWTLTATADGSIPLEPLPVTLEASEQREGVDLVLHLGARVSGVVFAANGAPAATHRVRATAVDEAGESQELAEEFTGADGRFLVSGLPPGPLTLQAEPGARADVHATLDEELVVDLRLRTPARVTGRVTDASGTPVSCEVKLYTPNGERWRAAETLSNTQGEYVLEDLPIGAAMLVAQQGATRTPPRAVQLSYDTSEVCDLQFAGGRIIGRVILEETGEPIEGVSVRASGLDLDDAANEMGVQHMGARAQTDEDGRFVLEALAPGGYLLAVHDLAYVPVKAGSTAVKLTGASATQDLFLARSATLSGRVSTTGTVEDGKLSITMVRTDGAGTRFGSIPFDGQYQVRGLSTGQYHYEVKRNSSWPPPPDQHHVFASGDVTVVCGETTLHDIVLVPMDG